MEEGGLAAVGGDFGGGMDAGAFLGGSDIGGLDAGGFDSALDAAKNDAGGGLDTGGFGTGGSGVGGASSPTSFDAGLSTPTLTIPTFAEPGFGPTTPGLGLSGGFVPAPGSLDRGIDTIGSDPFSGAPAFDLSTPSLDLSTPAVDPVATPYPSALGVGSIGTPIGGDPFAGAPALDLADPTPTASAKEVSFETTAPSSSNRTYDFRLEPIEPGRPPSARTEITDGLQTQTGYGAASGGVPIAELGKLTPDQARAGVNGHLDAYERSGDRASFKAALDLAAAWRAQGGDASGFDAIRARVGESSREWFEAKVAQDRADALSAAGGEIRALNHNNVNFGAELDETLRRIGNASDPDAAAYAVIRASLARAKGDLSAVGAIEASALRKTLDRAGYGGLFAEANRSLAQETAQDYAAERAKLAQLSPAERLSHALERALDSGLGPEVLAAGALIPGKGAGEFRRATEVKLEDKFASLIPPSPALNGSPYHPDSVAARVRPPYRPNPAHDPKSPAFNPRKTPEPADAESVYENAGRTDMGTWYGKGQEGWYRYFSDNAGGVHFSGVISESDVPSAILRGR